MSQADLEGRLRVRATLGGAAVRAVHVESTRLTRASQVLSGRPIAEALALLPLIFSRCGIAQAAAGLAAAESALGRAPGQGHHAARALLVTAESMQENAWRVLVDWAQWAGDEPALGAVARVRRDVAALPGLLYPARDWRRAGGGGLAPDHAALAALIAALDETLVPAALGAGHAASDVLSEADAFARWVRAEPTGAARALRRVEREGLAGFGRSPVPALPDLEGAWLDARIGADHDGSFRAAPSLDGEPRETGPLARLAGHPLVAALASDHGNGVLPRLAARLVELMAATGRMRALARMLADGGEGYDWEVRAPAPGLGVVENARGRLVHRVRLDGERVAGYRILAPTEWNFHPHGALAQGVLGATELARGGLDDAIRLLVTALDPCVECTVEVTRA